MWKRESKTIARVAPAHKAICNKEIGELRKRNHTEEGHKNEGAKESGHAFSKMELVKSNGPQSAIETLRPHARCSGNGLRQHARCLLRLMCRESQCPHGDEADGDEENGYRVLGEQAPLDDFLVGLRDMDMAPVR